MGINVLSGLVKVERGAEAERSGLQGPRPLSVSITNHDSIITMDRALHSN